MDFSIIGEITKIGTFALGKKIRELARLRKQYGRGRWRKRKVSHVSSSPTGPSVWP